MFRQVARTIIFSVAVGLAGTAVTQAVRSLADWGEPRVELVRTRSVDLPQPSDEGRLRFAVAGRVSAETTFSGYRDLVRMISMAVGRDDTFVLPPSYADVRSALERKEIDVALVCTGTYLHSMAAGRIRLLVQPEFADGLEYRCMVIVPGGSATGSLGDLRGKTIAFTDHESNTGYLAPCVKLYDLGFEPGTFFRKSVFTGSHDRSIQAVAAEIVDAAAIDSLVFASMRRANPGIERRVRAIWTSEPFGPPPVVVPSDIDPQLERALRQAFLSLHEDREGRATLAKLGIRRFIEPSHERYSGAIEMFEKYRSRSAEAWP